MKSHEEILSLRDHLALARHPQRPYLLDYVSSLFSDLLEIHGDRYIADDPAMVCGIARFHTAPVVVMGEQKGRELKSRQHRNFGMAKPEDYRNALRDIDDGTERWGNTDHAVAARFRLVEL